MLEKELIMKSEKIFEGKIVTLRCDTVELPGQRYAKREIVDHQSGVCTIAFDENDQLIFVKQYRVAVEKFFLELPAGIIELNEEPKVAAIRELKEETGYEAGSAEFLTEIYSSPGFTNERIHLFYARDLVKGEQDLDDSEDIEVIKLSLDEALKKVKLGEISDSKTVVGILLAERIRKAK